MRLADSEPNLAEIKVRKSRIQCGQNQLLDLQPHRETPKDLHLAGQEMSFMGALGNSLMR